MIPNTDNPAQSLQGSATVHWDYPRIGTCGEPIDTLRLIISRTRVIPDLIIGFDGERDGWVIYRDLVSADGLTSERKEVAFIIPEGGSAATPSITSGPSFVFGVTGVLVPGYRVEEHEGEWAIAHAANGREYLISKTEGGFMLSRHEYGDWIERKLGVGVIRHRHRRLTGEVVEVSAT